MPAGGTSGTSGLDLFVGDTLFAGSIGRTDLPGGDHQTLIQSITSVLFAFPDEARVYSGHGEPTTIGRERRTNPFLSGIEVEAGAGGSPVPLHRQFDRCQPATDPPLRAAAVPHAGR